MENVFDINPWQLDRVLIAEKHKLPQSSGLYFVFQQDELLYVGKTERSFNVRWHLHHRLDQLLEIQNVEIACWGCNEKGKALLTLESQAIKAFKPLLNGTRVPRKAGGKPPKIGGTSFNLNLWITMLYVMNADEMRKRKSKNLTEECLIECLQDKEMLDQLQTVIALKSHLSGLTPAEVFKQFLTGKEYDQIETTDALRQAWGSTVKTND